MIGPMETGSYNGGEAGYRPAAALLTVSTGGTVHEQAPASRPSLAGAELYALQPMEPLFVAGSARDKIYRVEAGKVVVSHPSVDSPVDDYEFVHPGSYIGFGILDQYAASAYAAEASTVSCISSEQFDELAAKDPDLAAQRSAAIEREYASHRAACIRSGVTATPLQRVARLLIALSNLAVREGSGLRAISDTLDSRFVAQLLDMPVEDLADRVSELTRLGLVRLDETSGILLHDISGLEAAC